MAQPLIDLVDHFCTFQRKQRGKTERGVKTYRWNLGQYVQFVAGRRGRPTCVGDLEPRTIQARMDSMAAADLALSTMRVRQSTLSSFCAFLVKRGHLDTNPVARLDRPPHRRERRRVRYQARRSWMHSSERHGSASALGIWQSS
jgi:site-specific recombinase XerC